MFSSSAARRTSLLTCLIPCFILLLLVCPLPLPLRLRRCLAHLIPFYSRLCCCFRLLFSCLLLRACFLSLFLSLSLSILPPFRLVTSSCASYSRQVCFICITNQPRASENLRKATYFTFLYHLLPTPPLRLSPPLLRGAF